jgi:hypothetical protein
MKEQAFSAADRELETELTLERSRYWSVYLSVDQRKPGTLIFKKVRDSEKPADNADDHELLTLLADYCSVIIHLLKPDSLTFLEGRDAHEHVLTPEYLVPGKSERTMAGIIFHGQPVPMKKSILKEIRQAFVKVIRELRKQLRKSERVNTKRAAP